MNGVNGKLLIAFLRVSGDADGSDDVAILIPDQHAPALGKELIA